MNKNKKYMKYCNVYGCMNKSRSVSESGLSFFRVPNDIERRREWLKVIDREDLTDETNLKKNKMYSYVCSIHFDDSDIISTAMKRLKSDAIPTKLLPNKWHANINSEDDSDSEAPPQSFKDLTSHVSPKDSTLISTYSHSKSQLERKPKLDIAKRNTKTNDLVPQKNLVNIKIEVDRESSETLQPSLKKLSSYLLQKDNSSISTYSHFESQIERKPKLEIIKPNTETNDLVPQNFDVTIKTEQDCDLEALPQSFDQSSDLSHKDSISISTYSRIKCQTDRKPKPEITKLKTKTKVLINTSTATSKKSPSTIHITDCTTSTLQSNSTSTQTDVLLTSNKKTQTSKALHQRSHKRKLKKEIDIVKCKRNRLGQDSFEKERNSIVGFRRRSC